MKISYQPLWALLKKRALLKKDLMAQTQLSSATIAKLAYNKHVSLRTLLKICRVLECHLNDIIWLE